MQSVEQPICQLYRRMYSKFFDFQVNQVNSKPSPLSHDGPMHELRIWLN